MAKLTGQSLNQNLELYRAIAKNVRQLRIELNKTQKELSEIIQISKYAWWLIESGDTRMEHGIVLAIANLLCLPSVECLSEKDFYKTVGDDWREKTIKKIEERKNNRLNG